MNTLGFTRSAHGNNHLLLTPDTFVRTPLPGLKGGVAIVHVSPQAGASFTQMTVELEAGGTLAGGPTQRFIYVLEGEVQLAEQSGPERSRAARSRFRILP